VAVLLSYIDDLTARMYFDTLWSTGTRLNEALALRPAYFELEPTRKVPQPIVILKTLKQREREASKNDRDTSRSPLQKTAGTRYPNCAAPRWRLRSAYGNTWQPGKSA